MHKLFLTISMIAATLLLSCNLSLSQKRDSREPLWVKKSITVVEKQAHNMLKDVIKQKRTPRSLERGLKPARDWTSGFYPGILWYLYENTGKSYWKKNARKVTSFLEQEQYNTDDHDVGFRIYCSYGNGWLLTKDTTYRKVIIQAAKSLSTRFNSKTQTIMSWNPSAERDWKFPVIIDNMMNLELIMEASKLSGDSALWETAVRHAQKTMRCHYRKDYSCSHVVDYDPQTGHFRKMDWNNGFCDPKIAAWSRGQGWGLYGFTLMYRETGDPQYLDFAEHIAHYILTHPNLPQDMIPYWDYNSPKIPSMRDASAAAITASALLELSTYSKKGKHYFKAAEKMLKSLSSPKYLATPGTNGNFAIKHATGNHMAGSEINGTLIYADYYYLEGLCRYLKIINHKPLFNQEEN